MNALSITDLKKTYKNGFHALKGINVNVKEGDFFGLLGPNGAGKTTLIGIISSLVVKSGGTVSVFGEDLDKNPEGVKRNIGLVPQELNFSIFENVTDTILNQAGFYGLPQRLAKQRAEKYLKKLELWEKRDEQVLKLSGGMKRRLMIARALAHEPKLLILDEPTAGVDIEIRRATWDFLREINQQGTTIILTTHYLEEAENLCQHIAIIDHGEIVEHSSTNALLTKLKIETFVLYLETPIAEAPTLQGFPTRLIDATTVEVDIDDLHNMNQLFEQLAKHKINVSRLRNKSNRLEELFIRLIK